MNTTAIRQNELTTDAAAAMAVAAAPLIAAAGLGVIGMLIECAMEDSNKAAVFKQAVRADNLRTAIQQGRRFRMDEIETQLQKYDITVEQIADELGLSVETVVSAIKRFWFF